MYAGSDEGGVRLVSVFAYRLSTIALCTSQPTKSMVASGGIARPVCGPMSGSMNATPCSSASWAHLVQHLEADAVAGERRRVAGLDDLAAAALDEEAARRRHHLGVGPGMRDQLAAHYRVSPVPSTMKVASSRGRSSTSAAMRSNPF